MRMLVPNATAIPVIGRLLAGTLLLGAAAMSWSASTLADNLARRHERVATLRPAADTASEEPISGGAGWRAPIEAAIDPDAADHGVVDEYWRGRYETLTRLGQGDRGDSSSLLVSANAVFRRAQREASSRPLTVERLDQSIQAYASALRNGGFSHDAAYNFEFVARLRDTTARSKALPRVAPGARPAAQPADAVLPPGPTIHGRPGTHPSSTRGEEFDTLTPMDYGDREAQPQPTPGQRLPRKG